MQRTKAGDLPPMMPRKALTVTLSLLPALSAPLPALAASSDWIVNEGGRARLVLLAPDAAGTRRGMVEIEPAPGWITYWREPGDSGIPPQLAPEAPATLVSLRFPAPKVLKLGALTDIGYDTPVALPVTLGKATGAVGATLFIGLCKDICIPFQAALAVSPDMNDTPEEAAAVAAAEAALPGRTLPGLALDSATLAAGSDAITLEVKAGAGRLAEAIVTGPAGYAFTASGTARADGGATLAVPLRGYRATDGLSGQAWRLLLKSGTEAIETDFALK